MYGIGIEKELVNPADTKKVNKKKEIACMCWYTKTGKAMPVQIKFEDDDGVIQTIDKIRVVSAEKKKYAGIPSYEYDCYIIIAGLEFEVKIIFYIEDCIWVMEY